MAKRKNWQEKLLAKKDLPKVVTVSENARKHWKANTMAVPSPLEVKEIMSQVPEGKLIILREIRKAIARKHHADLGCPLACGLFPWIVAYASEEEAMENRRKTLPYSRTFKTGGEVNQRYPGGLNRQRELLESKGHKIVEKGGKVFVENFEILFHTI
jgi:hypothetical protein